MKHIICSVLALNGAFSLAFSVIYFIQKKKHELRDFLFLGLCLSSAVWSIGFSAMYVRTSVEIAYICRSIAMAGAILFLFFSQTIVNVVPAIKKGYHIVFDLIAGIGIILYYPAIQRGQATFFSTPFGMSYCFNPTPLNKVLTIYFLITGADVLGVIIWMIFGARRKRTNAFGRRFLIAAILIVFGAFFDLLVPMLGFPALPGSNLTQFWGVLVVWNAMGGLDRAQVSVSNMSSYLYDSLATPVVIFNPNFYIEIVNDAASSFMNVNRDTIASEHRKITDFFDIKREDCFNVKHTTYSCELECKSNNRPCDLLINRIIDSYGDCIGFIISINDMTSYVESMEKLEEAYRNADAANRAKTEFLAHMSHEIRTPMNAIMGFSELALKEDISEPAAEDIRNITDASSSLLGIINDILDISKIESGKLELVCDKFSLVEVFESIYSIVSNRTVSKGLELTVDIDPLPGEVYGDRMRIREILINLLSNAIKYTPKGNVTISAHVIGAVGNTNTFEISVRDTGIGIRPEAIPTLFDAFQRTDMQKNASIEGTGLGLAIVKSYVGLMDGTIKVDSEYGKGSKFTVTITLVVTDPTPVEFNAGAKKAVKQHNNLGIADFSHYSVLVVDDNAVNRMLITKTLEKYKIKSEAVDSGQAAIDKCLANDYDIVFMDQMMPNMDGVEAMKIIRRDCPSYAPGSSRRIVALTANAILGVREELLSEGFDDYLEKPIDFAEFERVLKNEIKPT